MSAYDDYCYECTVNGDNYFLNEDAMNVHLMKIGSMKCMTERLVKDRDCADCKKVFDCQGKPESVKLCVKKEEVKPDDKSR